MADSSASEHPTGGRRRKRKSPALQTATDLPLPRAPDGLDSSEDEAERDAKRPRSTPTTLKSNKGLRPDECDRVMGIGSVEFSWENRDGEGDMPDIENPTRGVADDSIPRIDSSLGAVDISKGLAVQV